MNASRSCLNDTEDKAYAAAPPLRYSNHQRTGEQHFYDDGFSNEYGRYQYMTVMYGSSSEDVKRTFRIRSQISRGQLKRQTGSAAVCYVAVPMPTTKERFIWIDLAYPIRAFYVPSAYCIPAIQEARNFLAAYCPWPQGEGDGNESQQQLKKVDDGDEQQQQPETREEGSKYNDETPQPQSQNSSDSENDRDAAANNENTEPQPESDEASSMPGDETSDA
ncbi:hypothetical protein DID88_005961 [Monilinia fructigena]|uniref:Uncharacterized protein n=1 Tax=Monilinia fructigena TaxID=38457 RepID=A0A395J1Q1_9HELO|nr:hypothetical protein DID88_005961 [Monilinia fructigena]